MAQEHEIEQEQKQEQEILDDFELNRLGFYDAIKLDNRTFLQIYWGLLLREHLILFTFFVFNGYNLLYIKISQIYIFNHY